MQKLKRCKKGFTLTELAIVIAVIAILIALLVPTFISLINSANNSSDEQTVKNLNTVLSIDEAENGTRDSLCEVWETFEDAGYTPAPSPVYGQNTFYWYKNVNRIVIVCDNTITFPAEYAGITVTEASTNTGTALCTTAVAAENTLSLADDLIGLSTSKDSAAAHASEFAASGSCHTCGYASYAYQVANSIITVEGTTITAVQEGVTDLIIPDDITTINFTTFKASETLESITIGSGVTEIPAAAFKDCVNLTSVTLSEGLTKIGEYDHDKTPTPYGAFQGCTSLTEITIPDSVTQISTNAFNGCTSLTSITFGENSSLSWIGADAFKNCSLTSIAIPDNVTIIYGEAFYGCTCLVSVTFGENSTLTTINNNAFENCTSIESITLPASLGCISTNVFKSCTLLKSVTFIDTNNWNTTPNLFSLTSITVTNSNVNATNLTGTYLNYYWIKNNT